MRIMNKWQKIVGIVSLAILAIINFVIYGLSDMQTIYKGHPSVERVLSDSHDALLNIGYLVLANYLIIVFLFICRCTIFTKLIVIQMTILKVQTQFLQLNTCFATSSTY